VDDRDPREVNGSHDPADLGQLEADDQESSTGAVSAEPAGTEIEVILSQRKRLTYHYSGQPRSRALLIVVSVLACLVFIALPGFLALAIGPSLPIVRALSVIPIALSVPYVFFVIYRLFIQGTQPSAGVESAKKVRLSLSFAGEGRQLAGWAGGLTGIVAVISAIIEFIH
jgi:hypothetical protein